MSEYREFPKRITAADGQRVIVNSKEEEAAVKGQPAAKPSVKPVVAPDPKPAA